MNILSQNDYTHQRYILVILVILFILFLIWLLYKGRRDYINIEIIETPAILIEISSSVSGNALSGLMSRNMNLGLSYSRNRIKFQFDNGDIIEFLGNSDTIEQSMIGKKGILKYQGAKLISFTI